LIKALPDYRRARDHSSDGGGLWQFLRCRIKSRFLSFVRDVRRGEKLYNRAVPLEQVPLSSLLRASRPGDDPAVALETAEARALVAGAVSTLNAADQQLCREWLRRQQVRAMARALGISPQWLRCRLRRLLQKLARRLRDLG
jgi:hypothetical protein